MVATRARQTSDHPVVAYLSDAEGLWSKLESFAHDNPWVRLADSRLEVAPGAVFVFGGDAIDRGPAARRIVSTLLEAKERQPGQVVLLAGNRDINKMRLPRELTGHPPRRAPDEMRAADQPTLLRWIFSNTMGAKEAFEQRRTELVRTGQPSNDQAVVDSYLLDLGPGGDMARYLAACQLAYRHGTTLFVHGHVTEDNLGRVPGAAPVDDGVDAWVGSLNRWYDEQIEAFRSDAHDAHGEPAWAPLVAYQAPLPGTRLNQSSVVYARPTDADGNPSLPTPALIASLGRTDERLHTRSVTRLGEAIEPVVIAIERGADSPVGKRVADTGHLVKGQLSSGDFLLQRSESGFRVHQRAVAPGELAAMRLEDPWR
ncbi:MAG: hypothetical protein EOO75_04070 [Myxococcales bacterium]|nr:MAG: hypothetical protein EOO75_04070 [Myxococcales bacterium]